MENQIKTRVIQKAEEGEGCHGHNSWSLNQPVEKDCGNVPESSV